MSEAFTRLAVLAVGWRRGHHYQHQQRLGSEVFPNLASRYMYYQTLHRKYLLEGTVSRLPEGVAPASVWLVEKRRRFASAASAAAAGAEPA